MDARDIMTPEVIRVEPDEPIQEVAKLMAENRISAVPVAKDDKLVGIVSEGDMLLGALSLERNGTARIGRHSLRLGPRWRANTLRRAGRPRGTL